MGIIENSTLTLTSTWVALNVDQALGNEFCLGTVKKIGPLVSANLTKGTQVVFKKVNSMILTNEGKELVFVKEEYIVCLAVPK